jgi:hypothetical protein
VYNDDRVVRAEDEAGTWSLLSLLLLADMFASLVVLRAVGGLFSGDIVTGGRPRRELAGDRSTRGDSTRGVG